MNLETKLRKCEKKREYILNAITTILIENKNVFYKPQEFMKLLNINLELLQSDNFNLSYRKIVDQWIDNIESSP